MKLQEKIYHSINTMNRDELLLLYEHIQLIEHIKQMSSKRTESLPIEEILTMTSSSTGCWAACLNQNGRWSG